MSLLSPRLQLRVAQKQILTPGLVQMVTVLQLNRLELRDMITAEITQNPVLEESADGGEELTQEEVQQILERERTADPADRTLLDALGDGMGDGLNGAAADYDFGAADGSVASVDGTAAATTAPAVEPATGTESDGAAETRTEAADPFDEIDF